MIKTKSDIVRLIKTGATITLDVRDYDLSNLQYLASEAGKSNHAPFVHLVNAVEIETNELILMSEAAKGTFSFDLTRPRDRN